MISHIIKDGTSTLLNYRNASWREPEGYQVVLRYLEDLSQVLVVVHIFGGDIPDKLEINLSNEFFIYEVLKSKAVKVLTHKNKLIISGYEQFEGIVVYARKED